MFILFTSFLGLAACAGGEGGDPSDEVTRAAEDFLADMRAGAWHAAYGRLYADLQATCGSGERLKRVIEANGVRPQSWTLRQPSVRRRSGLITGAVEYTGGDQGIIELSMDRIDGEWQIVAWSMDNRELCKEAEE